MRKRKRTLWKGRSGGRKRRRGRQGIKKEEKTGMQVGKDGNVGSMRNGGKVKGGDGRAEYQ